MTLYPTNINDNVSLRKTRVPLSHETKWGIKKTMTMKRY